MWIAKLGAHLPLLLARAAAGDPTAIAELVASGIAVAVYSANKNK